jgi:hypothetical protein
MFRGQPWTRRTGFLLLIVALFSGTVVRPHVDDPACASAAVLHDESAHRLTAGTERANADGDHCFLCHTFRSYHPPSDRFGQRDAVRESERLHVRQVRTSERAAWSAVAERAPPV